VIYHNAGDVGVGTPLPEAVLHVNGAQGDLMVVGDGVSANSMVVSSTGAGTHLNMTSATAGSTASLVATDAAAQSTWSSNDQEASVYVDSNESRVRAGRSEFTGGNGYSCVFKVNDASTASPHRGSLVAVDPFEPGSLRVAELSLDDCPVGVIAGEATLGSAWQSGDAAITVGKVSADPGLYRVVVMGRAVVDAEAISSPIKTGDQLVCSPFDGHVMSAAALNGPLSTGTVIGKALESLNSGTGQLLILVQPR